MNLKCRFKSRIENEGLLKTLFYVIHAVCYCLRECLCDAYLDLRFNHRFLNGNIKTSYKMLGANDVYHTKYTVLPKIFRLVKISKADVLVDVGCGKGRVISYWLSRHYRNKMIGLELDEQVAAKTRKQLSRWKNVTIISGNAIQNLPNDGTIFYFYNPFSKEIVEQFENKLAEMYKNKPITIIYYNPKSIDIFRNSNWKIRYINFEKDLGIKRWGRINKYHDLAIIKSKY